MSKTDSELFGLSVRAACVLPPSRSIGTENEHRLHTALKYYFQPNPDFHEFRVAGYICDAFSGGTVYEIQTQCLYRLSRKLEAILPVYPVTVVYPVITEKTVLLTDASGNLLKKFRSPAKKTLIHLAAELYGLRKFLFLPGLKIKAVSLTVTEIRTENAKNKRKKFVTTDKIPEKLTEITDFSAPDDYRRIVPDSLGETFTSEEFSVAAKIPKRLAIPALNVLKLAGVVIKTGKSGRLDLYKRSY